MSLTKANYSMISGSTVNVLDFGASPDATAAVNGAAFEAALTYTQNTHKPGTAGAGSAGGVLFIPAGNYNIDRSLDIGYGVTMRGEGVYATILIFDGSISGSGSYCVSVGPSTVPGYTFGYTFGTRLESIGIACGGTEDIGVKVPGMHQHSRISNVNIRGVKNIGLDLGTIGGPAYCAVEYVSIATSTSPDVGCIGIVANGGATTSLKFISVEAEYGQTFAIGIDVEGNADIDVAHFAYCTKGVNLKAIPAGLYADRASVYMRNMHDDSGGASTDLIYVEGAFRGNFVIENTYSYSVPIGTPGNKILNNQITGESIPSSKTVNFYRYPSWSKIYSEPQTADPLEATFTPAITADVDNTTDTINRPAMKIQQTGTDYATFVPGYGSGFAMTFTDNVSIWPTGCRYILDSDALIATTSGVDLGNGTYRFATLYATNGTINTSDENEKQQIADLSDAERAVATAIKAKIKKFKFNDAVADKGDNARIHVGVIAQDVKAAFEAQSLDPNAYGIFCSDTWYEVDGKKFDEATGKDYIADSNGAVEITRLGVRYDELLAFIISVI